jgi:hypothetical protein
MCPPDICRYCTLLALGHTLGTSRIGATAVLLSAFAPLAAVKLGVGGKHELQDSFRALSGIQAHEPNGKCFLSVCVNLL